MTLSSNTTLIDDVRTVLRSAGGPMTAKEVREAIGEDGTQGGISTSLARLVSTGEAVLDRDAFPGTYTLTTAASRKADARTAQQPPAPSPTPAPAETPPAAQAATGGKRGRKPRASAPKGAEAPAPKKRGRPRKVQDASALGLPKRKTKRQLRAPAARTAAPSATTQPVPADTAPATEKLVRLAAGVIASWPQPLDTMPTHLAAQLRDAFNLGRAA